MTTLYDRPVPTTQQQTIEDEQYDTSDAEADLQEEITEYDLDVVDDALLNPNSSQYLDHFGFTIQVRTDDESSSDDDSDFGHDDCHHVAKATPATTVTTTSDEDDDDDSIDTPHHTHHHPKTQHPQQKELVSSVPILKSPPTPRPDNNNNNRQRSASTTTNDTQKSTNSSNNRASILSTISSFNNPFKTARPASITSLQSPPTPAIIPTRPSESFQQRQSKRYSEAAFQLSATPRSPASQHRYFDKLVSKFRRFSHNDHQYDSEKHLHLKEEALAELEIYREKGGYENNSIDWGKSLLYKSLSLYLFKCDIY